MSHPPQIQIGAATVRVIDCGTLMVHLAAWLGLDSWAPAHADLFTVPVPVAVQCFHVALPGRSLLVDACHPALLPQVGEKLADRLQPPGLLEQLGALGVDPEAIDTVVITHPHFDHYCGLIALGATPADDRPLFPQARHLLGAADWDALQPELGNPTAPAARVIGLLARQGLLAPVSGAHDLGDGLRLVPLPGETPGHQGLRVESAGQVLYIVGDLYHHAAEVAEPTWNVTWADAATNSRSRAALAYAALHEEAVLLAAHLPGAGRLERTGSGLRWAPVYM